MGGDAVTMVLVERTQLTKSLSSTSKEKNHSEVSSHPLVTSLQDRYSKRAGTRAQVMCVARDVETGRSGVAKEALVRGGS